MFTITITSPPLWRRGFYKLFAAAPLTSAKADRGDVFRPRGYSPFPVREFYRADNPQIRRDIRQFGADISSMIRSYRISSRKKSAWSNSNIDRFPAAIPAALSLFRVSWLKYPKKLSFRCDVDQK